MPLTLAQKSSARRHLKYPVAGPPQISPAGGTLMGGAASWRFFQAFGFLEYKLNNLAPDEEARLLGNALAAVAIVGRPNPGDSVTVTLSGGAIASPQALTATVPALSGGQDARLNVTAALANAANQNTVLAAAGVIALAPFGTGAFAQNAVPLPEVAFEAPAPFAVAITSQTGQMGATITANGAQLPPTTQLDGVTTTWGYLPILDGLEGAYLSASQNLDTIKADVWKGRANEAGQRRSLYENFVQQMSDFLGVPVNRRAFQRPGRTGAIRFA